MYTDIGSTWTIVTDCVQVIEYTESIKKRGDESMLQVGEKNKTERILTIYKMFLDGETINKAKMAEKFGVNNRSIQRDIEDIRAYIMNRGDETGENVMVVYDRKKNGFRLSNGAQKMSGGEFLAVSKILLESRAFMKEELEPILEKLIFNCAPPSEQKQAAALIANERYHYTEPHHRIRLTDKLWEMGSAVKNQQYMEIWYRKLKENEPVRRMIKPVGIMFSEFYFYLVAFIEKEGEAYLSPAIYRIDRILSFQVLNKHFSVPYKDRFEEGEFRKRVQFMYGGPLQRIVFEYSGISLEAVLDRLPTARVIEEKEAKDGKGKIYTIRAEVFGNGIDMWMRSQGEIVKIVSKKIM